MAHEKAVAVITIKDAGEMTADGRKVIADWIRRQADDLERDGPEYAGRFRARYMTVDGAA